MNPENILQAVLAIAPSVVVGLVAYYLFNNYMKNEENRRYYLLKKENQKEVLPYRIQALERMTLFLERIDPGQLIVRVKPKNEDKFAYETMLIKTIEKEFEHNLTQQIYLSTECWQAIIATKNATISMIRKSNMNEQIQTADKLREVILTELLDKSSPSKTGLAYLKKEAKSLW